MQAKSVQAETIAHARGNSVCARPAGRLCPIDNPVHIACSAILHVMFTFALMHLDSYRPANEDSASPSLSASIPLGIKPSGKAMEGPFFYYGLKLVDFDMTGCELPRLKVCGR